MHVLTRKHPIYILMQSSRFKPQSLGMFKVSLIIAPILLVIGAHVHYSIYFTSQRVVLV